MCHSWRGNEEEWSLTSCPAAPENITQMLLVGETFQDECRNAAGV